MRTIILVVGLILIGSLLFGCKRSSSHHGSSFTGSVVDGTGTAVAQALVCLIPSKLIDGSTILNHTVLTGEAEEYDEPLEDAADSGDPSILTAVTNAAGGFSFGGIPEGSFFVFVKPDANDKDHLPGGDKCRIARPSRELTAGMKITLSGRPSDSATFVGTSMVNIQ